MNEINKAIAQYKKLGICVKNTDLYAVYENKNFKYIEAKDNSFHLFFRKYDGFTAKWGKTPEEDPIYCPFGNEIADIEITKSCSGIRNEQGFTIPCPWCYKSNAKHGDNMSFETFKKIFHKLNESKTMTQIAFGADASLTANPDVWKIFAYTKDHGVTPNVTVADISRETARKIVNFCGACAVSYYPSIDKNRCYDSVKLLLDECKQQNKRMAINIHALLASETLESIEELAYDIKNDSRLHGVNAVVFLSLKQKGRGKFYNPVSNEQFSYLIDYYFKEKIPFGMDSCSANKFINAIENRKDKNALMQLIEPCERLLFSAYIDCYGTFYPCSFMEKIGDWEEGINVLDVKDFVKEVWYNEKSIKDRHISCQKIFKDGCNSCPYYKI